MDMREPSHQDVRPTLGKRVALFGGGFNPPHLAHAFTVTYLLSRADVDEVWLLPAVRHAFDKQLASLEDRIRLLEDSLISGDRVKLCLIEAESEMSGRTFDTLDILQERHPEMTFTLVIGADNLTESHRWHRFDDLCARWSIIALGRPGHERALSEMSAQPWCLPGPTLMSVSSTEIREALRAQESPDWSSEPLSWLPERTQPLALKLYGGVVERSALDHASETSTSLVSPSDLQSVTIWGSGRCGRSLAHALESAQIEVHLVSLRSLDVDRERHQHVWPQRLSEALDSELWILACRDGDLERWAGQLAGALARDQGSLGCEPQMEDLTTPEAVLHCSGARSHEVLRPLRALGVALGRMHPLMSLRGEGDRLRGASCLVSGDQIARQRALKLVALLGANAIREPLAPTALSEPQRLALYHCAAALGANLASVPLVIGELIFQRLGYERVEASHALRALYEVALTPHLSREVNVNTTLVEQWSSALTGPVARGDHDTVTAHLEALTALATLEEIDDALYELFNITPALYQSLSVAAAYLVGRDELAERLQPERSSAVSEDGLRGQTS